MVPENGTQILTSEIVRDSQVKVKLFPFLTSLSHPKPLSGWREVKRSSGVGPGPLSPGLALGLIGKLLSLPFIPDVVVAMSYITGPAHTNNRFQSGRSLKILTKFPIP